MHKGIITWIGKGILRIIEGTVNLIAAWILAMRLGIIMVEVKG